MDINQKIDSLLDETIERIKTVVSYDSVSVYDKNNAEHPFGQVCTDVLNTALEMADNDGFKTVNLDNKVGYVEYGTGEKVVGVLSHLDIVPCGEGWNTDPLELVIEDDCLVGRGVTDDKGPAIASLAALKIIKQLVPNPSKRIRLIWGLNEESGSLCIKHYVAKEGHVDCGFTPDSNFPLIFGEKGSIGATFKGKSKLIKKIDGGTVSNAVCYKVTALLDSSMIDESNLKQALDSFPVSYECVEDNEGLHITVIGKAAHASTPELGINAISYLMQAIFNCRVDDAFVNHYMRVFGLQTNGENAGIGCYDEYGTLTCVTGVIHSNDDIIEGTIDIRVPVKHDPKELAKVLENNSQEGFVIEITKANPPLFYDPNSDFIQALYKAYVDVTKDTERKPMVIGGGTYAQSIHNVIAFGPEYEGFAYNIHDVNERLPIKELKEMIAIYVQALLNLLDL